MLSLIASLVLATTLPADFIDSAGVAAYWYRKDSRGKGDSISEQAKPRRFPAFALSPDTFILGDPGVRAKHLDRVELWFGSERYPATEIARGEFPDTVMIRTDRPVAGVRPLVFAAGEPVERVSWQWTGDNLGLVSSSVGTNSDVKVDAVTRRAFHRGPKDSLLLDDARRPVALDFGDFSFVEGGRFVPVDAVKRCNGPVDGYEKAAAAVEAAVAKATLPIVIRLEQQDKAARRRYSWDDDAPAAPEFDTLGLVIGGRVLVPSSMSGEDIARFKCAEATFADGSKTNLVFDGALAEWNAVVFTLPAPCVAKVGSLSVSTAEAHGMLGERAWAVRVENEGGSPVAEAVRTRFLGVEFLQGAKFAPGADTRGYDGYRSSDEEAAGFDLVLAASGEIATMDIRRRYGRRYDYRSARVCAADLADAVAGRAYNPEFRPRAEEDRNRVVWLGIESVELTAALAREKRVQSFLERYSRPPYVTEVYPGSPCAKAGVKAGDILLAYRRGAEGEQRIRSSNDYSGRDWSMYFDDDEPYSYYGISATPWTDVESETNRELSKFGVGAKITLVYIRDGRRCETELTLEAAPAHYKNAPKSRNRTLGTLVKDMTFEVRRFFKFDEKAPGVVVAKIKPGSPAAVAGLKVYELITEVNGEKVTGAKDFAAKVKGRSDLVFTVRRLAQTRMVKIHVDQTEKKEN